MRKQPHVTEQTRANLRQAFWELYATKPLKKISVREITERAGYNRATFYLYYHDVNELLDEIVDTVMGDVDALIKKRLLRGTHLDFSGHMGIILWMAREYRPYIRVLLGPGADPAFAERLKDTIWPLIDRFVMPAAGRSLDEGDRVIVRSFYLDGLLAAVRAWLMDDDPMPIDRLIGLLVRTVVPDGPAGGGTCPAEGPDAAAPPPDPAASGPPR